MNIVLRRFEGSSSKYKFYGISNGELNKPIWNEDTEILGFFEKHGKDFFCFWAKSETLYISAQGKVLSLRSTDEVNCESKLSGKELSVTRDGLKVFSFRYMTLLSDPLSLFDEDWGDDLPSYFEGCFNNSDGIESLNKYLNAFKK